MYYKAYLIWSRKGIWKMKKNIILIGMPGAGKSTVGVILAKVMGMNFIDSDLLIQEQEGMLLRNIIDRDGQEGYLDIENRVNLGISEQNCVIATGGSAIYCDEAMLHLKKTGIVVYIRLSLGVIRDRLGNIRQRGVVLKDGQTLDSLYEERCPLYEKYADVTVDGEGLGLEELMEKIVVTVQPKP